MCDFRSLLLAFRFILPCECTKRARVRSEKKPCWIPLFFILIQFTIVFPLCASFDSSTFHISHLNPIQISPRACSFIYFILFGRPFRLLLVAIRLILALAKCMRSGCNCIGRTYLRDSLSLTDFFQFVFQFTHTLCVLLSVKPLSCRAHFSLILLISFHFHWFDHINVNIVKCIGCAQSQCQLNRRNIYMCCTDDMELIAFLTVQVYRLPNNSCEFYGDNNINDRHSTAYSSLRFFQIALSFQSTKWEIIGI